MRVAPTLKRIARGNGEQDRDGNRVVDLGSPVNDMLAVYPLHREAREALRRHS
jgi:hypothetical protein